MIEDYDKALTDYRAILDRAPSAPDVLLLMAETFYKAGDTVNSLERCMAITDTEGLEDKLTRRMCRRLHNLMADIYSELGEHDLSEQHRRLGRK